MKIELKDRGVLEIGRMLSDAGYETRLVGGAVRDLIAGLPPKDMDLTSVALPQEVMKIADGAGYRVIPTGLQHGTVTVVFEGEAYEITTLRKDIETDGRHAVVEYVSDFREDASRRDFTFNAMSASLDGVVHDYFGGVRDLSEGRIRFVGNARQRIEEDYLRVLRFFRFRARFGGNESEEDFEVISQTSGGLATIAVERVWSEVSKMLTLTRGVDQLYLMSALGVSGRIGLDCSCDRLKVVSCLSRDGRRPSVMMGVLLGDVADAESLSSRWKLSNVEALEVISAAEVSANHTHDANYWLSRAVDGLSPSVAIPVLAATGRKDAAEALSGGIPTFPLMGRDLVGIIEQGPSMGDVLRGAKRLWVESEFKLTREDLLVEISASAPTIGRF